MYLIKTPQLIRNLFPGFVWNMASEHRNLYLTFDDGPIPEVTPWVLAQLEKYRAKATFFCVGENVARHPKIFEQLVSKGHSVGNHTHNHLSGWNTDNLSYFHNVRRAATVTKSTLFRPPYGRLKPSQQAFLSRHYQIIMWDVLSGDFDVKITAEQCLQNVLRNSEAGSIIVFHDSLKAQEKLQYVLPKVLQYYHERGFNFAAISEDNLNRNKRILRA